MAPSRVGLLLAGLEVDYEVDFDVDPASDLAARLRLIADRFRRAVRPR